MIHHSASATVERATPLATGHRTNDAVDPRGSFI
jgi:hypothetical protein